MVTEGNKSQDLFLNHKIFVELDFFYLIKI